MKTGFAPRHWTLYDDESLRIRSSSSARRSSSSWSSAASRSIANVHSYGYETNGTRSCSRTAAAPSSRRVSATEVPTSLPSATRRAKSCEPASACQSAQPVLRKRAQDAAVVVEDAAVPVAEGARL